MSPIEALYPLTGPIPAGSYTLTADGLAVTSPDVVFTLVWRRAPGTAGPEASSASDVPPSPDLSRLDSSRLDATRSDASRPDASNPDDTVIVRFQHAYTGTGPGQYQATLSGAAIPSHPGDKLALRISVAADSPGGSHFIPYGEQKSSPTMRWITVAIP